jgi:hypothetical protein
VNASTHDSSIPGQRDSRSPPDLTAATAAYSLDTVEQPGLLTWRGFQA